MFMLTEAAGTVSQHVQFGYILLGVPSGRLKDFDIRFPRFYNFSAFRMPDQSFWCPKAICGGQSKSVQRRLQQACFLQ
jgi:hypothetical protein